MSFSGDASNPLVEELQVSSRTQTRPISVLSLKLPKRSTSSAAVRNVEKDPPSPFYGSQPGTGISISGTTKWKNEEFSLLALIFAAKKSLDHSAIGGNVPLLTIEEVISMIYNQAHKTPKLRFIFFYALAVMRRRELFLQIPPSNSNSSPPSTSPSLSPGQHTNLSASASPPSIIISLASSGSTSLSSLAEAHSSPPSVHLSSSPQYLPLKKDKEREKDIQNAKLHESAFLAGLLTAIKMFYSFQQTQPLGSGGKMKSWAQLFHEEIEAEINLTKRVSPLLFVSKDFAKSLHLCLKIALNSHSPSPRVVPTPVFESGVIFPSSNVSLCNHLPQTSPPLTSGNYLGSRKMVMLPSKQNSDLATLPSPMKKPKDPPLENPPTSNEASSPISMKEERHAESEDHMISGVDHQHQEFRDFAPNVTKEGESFQEAKELEKDQMVSGYTSLVDNSRIDEFSLSSETPEPIVEAKTIPVEIQEKLEGSEANTLSVEDKNEPQLSVPIVRSEVRSSKRRNRQVYDLNSIVLSLEEFKETPLSPLRPEEEPLAAEFSTSVLSSFSSSASEALPKSPLAQGETFSSVVVTKGFKISLNSLSKLAEKPIVSSLSAISEGDSPKKSPPLFSLSNSPSSPESPLLQNLSWSPGADIKTNLAPSFVVSSQVDTTTSLETESLVLPDSSIFPSPSNISLEILNASPFPVQEREQEQKNSHVIDAAALESESSSAKWSFAVPQIPVKKSVSEVQVGNQSKTAAVADSTPNQWNENALLSTCSSLMDFLSLNANDVFSLLTGLTPSKLVVDFVKINRFQTEKQFRDYSPCDLVQLCRLVSAWSDPTISSPSPFYSIHNLAAHLRGCHSLVKGDLVVFNFSPGHYLYGQFVEYVDRKDFCSLVFGVERTECIVGLKSVYPLGATLMEEIYQSGHLELENLSSYIDDPTESMIQEVETIVSNFLIDLFHSQGFSKTDFSICLELALFRENSKRVIADGNLQQRVNLEEFGILPLQRSRPLSLLLSHLQNFAPSATLAQQAEAHLKSSSKLYLVSMSRWNVFITHRNRFEKFRKMQASDFLEQELESLKSKVQAALDGIHQKSRDILEGIRKKQLTTWWLGKIRDRTSNHLVKKFASPPLSSRISMIPLVFLLRVLTFQKKKKKSGYDLLAVPPNYTDVPPKSVRRVAKNLKILEETLSTEHDSFSVSRCFEQLASFSPLLCWLSPTFSYQNHSKKTKLLIEEVKAEIYPKIDEFLSDAVTVVLNEVEFSFSHDESSPVDVEYLKQKVDSCNSLEQETRVLLLNLIKDIEYLKDMKRIEEGVISDLEKKSLFHIVPVTGLIISVFLRMQNECKTVLELWKDRIFNLNASSNPTEIKTASSSFSCSSLNGNTVMTALYQGDPSNGSPPSSPSTQMMGEDSLLIAAVNQSKTEEVNRILQFEPVNINAVDKRGWTALHLCVFSSGRLPVRTF